VDPLSGGAFWENVGYNNCRAQGLRIMAYEYLAGSGILRPLKAGRDWAVQMHGRWRGQRTSLHDESLAAPRHSTGLNGWDRTQFFVSDDLLSWRLVGENL
jgi:hypothetical protein